MPRHRLHLVEHDHRCVVAVPCLDSLYENGYHARSAKGGAVRLLKTRQVPALTGLTVDQIRDWTVRRGLIQPDIPARKRGSEAKFSWQTVLLLRLVVVLRNRFHVELQAHRDLLLEIRALLEGRSFIALWGERLAICGLRRAELVRSLSDLHEHEDVIILTLDRHLEVLSREFGFQDTFRQLPLFSVTHAGDNEVIEDQDVLAKGIATWTR